ncbi:NACHT domain-containing protein [Nocardia gamkensis]|uniref:NACHT domain-containing protein n=1 Tax=Nocardia gamkensis TaxID=352869 RepID=UPI0037C8CC73
METGVVVRVVAALIKPLTMLWQLWRPRTDRVSVAALVDDLAEAVRQEEQRLREGLRAGPGSFMHVGFTATAKAQPGEVIESAAVSDIATYFELLTPPRRLVVLGEPGSGKTVAAAHLVLGLLETRRDLVDTRRAGQPVPVRVNAAGWNGKEDFSGWLATRLRYDYRVRPRSARALVDAGLILPVVDGLDEMDAHDSEESRARAVLNRLNETPWGNRPVVVVCRSDEFDELTRLGEDNGLHGSTTITLRPFTPGQISDYLTTYQHRIGATRPIWTAVTTRITAEPEGPLARALNTPWMLGLAATAMHHDPHTAGQLTGCSDTDAVRDLLFAAQIPAAVAGTDRTGRFRGYTSDNVRTWLLSLARCLDQRRDLGQDGTTIRLDEIWEIAGSVRCRILHGLTVCIAMTLVIVAAVGLRLGLVFGPAIGLVFGLSAGLSRSPRANRMAWRVPARSRWRGGLTYGLAAGLTFGLTVEFALGTWLGLAAAITAGLTVGLTFGLEADAEDQLGLAVDERRLIRDDVRVAVFTAGVVAFAIGLALGLPTGLLGGLSGGLVNGLAFGLAAGTVGGLTFGLALGLMRGLAATRYLIAMLVFRFTSPFPSRPGLFLDWARRSGLLRVTGTGYQFRHETYRQWLQQPRIGRTER